MTFSLLYMAFVTKKTRFQKLLKLQNIDSYFFETGPIMTKIFFRNSYIIKKLK